MKTQLIEEEFEQILSELQERRKNKEASDGFYYALREYYQEGGETHASPTRRLIQQKNAQFEHKQTFKDQNVETADYKFVYTPGPEKSYVIEPHGG